MADGKLKAIETVKSGDYVLSRDPVTKKTEARKVLSTTKRKVDALRVLYLADGTVIHTTDEHPFFVKGTGFVPAKDLNRGDEIETLSGKYVGLKKQVALLKTTYVYNLTVEDFHTYFVSVDRVWVHNTAGTCKEIAAEATFMSKVKYIDGKTFDAVEKNIPSHWKKVRSDDGHGWKWLDKNGIERVRYKLPKKDEADVVWIRERQGAWRWKDEEGYHLDANGRRVLPPGNGGSVQVEGVQVRQSDPNMTETLYNERTHHPAAPRLRGGK
jgi:hypothetical protein